MRGVGARAVAVVSAIAVIATAGVSALTVAAGPSEITSVGDQAVMYRACVSRAGDGRAMTPEVAEFVRVCQAAFTPAPSPSASTSPSASASPSVSPSASSSPSVSPSASTSPPAEPGCPAWPAFPDENCTGWRHTGVTLTACARYLNVANATYDRCRFDGSITIAADNITIRRSLINGVVGSVNGNNRMRGLQLIDVEIAGNPSGTDQLAAVGTEDYSCLRCHVHGGYRGFALGSNNRIVDSYAHGFRVQANAHQTAASTHGGRGVFIDHSRFRCESNRYACSNGISFYSEQAGGIDDVVIQRSFISTDAGYAIGFFSLVTGKPYGITNTRILNNTIGGWEYGPRANWPASQAGNVWAGNVQATFDPGCRCP